MVRFPLKVIILAGAALAALAATEPLIDPTPEGCDAYVQFSGTVCGSTRRYLAPDELILLGESARRSTQMIRAWKKHDVTAIQATIPADFRLAGPDGKVMRKADIVADIRRRMAMTRMIDSITAAIRVDTIATNSAILRSRQFFSRIVALPDSTQRRRFSSATHREVWIRKSGRWVMRSFTEENQVERWVDDAAK